MNSATLKMRVKTYSGRTALHLTLAPMFSHIRQDKTISRCVGDPRAHDNTTTSLPGLAHGFRPFPNVESSDHLEFFAV